MTENYKRLSINFHQTFIPEKRYISALIRYAGGNHNQGTMQEISSITGIPMGESSGKAPAILNYAQGMGLVTVEKGDTISSKKTQLTNFGRTVLLEDPNLSEQLTQWVAHFNMCRSIGGAETWHLTFGPGRDFLGMKFSEKNLEAYLTGILGKKNKSIIGPMLRMYQEPASFKTSNLINIDDRTINRSAAPILKGFINAYSAIFLLLFETHFPDDRQITVSDFEDATFWKRIAGWSDQQNAMILEMIQTQGAINIDRQMQPWILTRKSESKSFWRTIYNDLV